MRIMDDDLTVRLRVAECHGIEEHLHPSPTVGQGVRVLTGASRRSMSPTTSAAG